MPVRLQMISVFVLWQWSWGVVVNRTLGPTKLKIPTLWKYLLYRSLLTPDPVGGGLSKIKCRRGYCRISCEAYSVGPNEAGDGFRGETTPWKISKQRGLIQECRRRSQCEQKDGHKKLSVARHGWRLLGVGEDVQEWESVKSTAQEPPWEGFTHKSKATDCAQEPLRIYVTETGYIKNEILYFSSRLANPPGPFRV